ncbi:MAG TPA: cytochrome c biogenesis protein CcdA, partial [Bacteroidales bacterium]|nr:cytochrome c biogenesis protein CcdA [Bacteroidales bacterium]
MNRIFRITTVFLLLAQFGFSQSADWKFRYEYVKTNPQEVDVFMDITIPKDFHMYSFDQGPGGPIAAEVQFVVPAGVKKIGGLQSLTKPREYFDDIFGITARDFGGKITWKQRFYVGTSDAFKITGKYSYQLCQDDGMCINSLPEKFSVSIPAPTLPKKQVDTAKSVVSQVDIPLKTMTTDTIAASDSLTQGAASTEPESIPSEFDDSTAGMSLLWIFIFGFLGGLLAFLTPCVFPMVPMTVSMFIKRSKQKAVRDVSLYGISIVGIYVVLGLLITVVFGVDALNKMSTSPLFNIAFFAIFLLFAISFFGAFELVLPSSWVNFMDKKADTSSGFASIFFMAFTLVLVSFSCTAMIIGTLLVQSVVSGSLLGPFMGMLGFSIALALPFVVFAFVPSLITTLGKSGGWLQSVKVTLGFIELGF